MARRKQQQQQQRQLKKNKSTKKQQTPTPTPTPTPVIIEEEEEEYHFQLDASSLFTPDYTLAQPPKVAPATNTRHLSDPDPYASPRSSSPGLQPTRIPSPPPCLSRPILPLPLYSPYPDLRLDLDLAPPSPTPYPLPIRRRIRLNVADSSQRWLDSYGQYAATRRCSITSRVRWAPRLVEIIGQSNVVDESAGIVSEEGAERNPKRRRTEERACAEVHPRIEWEDWERFDRDFGRDFCFERYVRERVRRASEGRVGETRFGTKNAKRRKFGSV